MSVQRGWRQASNSSGLDGEAELCLVLEAPMAALTSAHGRTPAQLLGGTHGLQAEDGRVISVTAHPEWRTEKRLSLSPPSFPSLECLLFYPLCVSLLNRAWTAAKYKYFAIEIKLIFQISVFYLNTYFSHNFLLLLSLYICAETSVLVFP